MSLYDTSRWKKLRKHHLTIEPLCVFCQQQGRVEAASVVDHIEPHKGNLDLFYNADNLQSLCKQHHDSAKQAAERRGVKHIGCGVDGQPLDPHHHWNR